jgi:hypothetical protein
VRVIVPGDPDASALVRRIESHDPDEIMPQDPDKKLSAEQIAMLREWVRQGAEFRDHWAFEKPLKPAPPQVDDAGWCRNEIDHFVLARMQKAGLRPSPNAGRRQLIRRATLDLTGLLPTTQEVDDFVADSAADAYERLIDRLLNASRYGEHRARYWMDYARYGDTQGLHTDAYQSRWPYRDYVIKAFNADMPYDQFTREQLAGDLLPPTHVDELTATGFVRCGIATGEGGTIIEELRVNLARERTEMYGAVYLGLTTGCAACHDHKYDPFTQRDFYALSAFFNNIAEKSSCDDRIDWPPNIHVPTAAKREAHDAVLAQKAAVLQKLAMRRAAAGRLISEWLATGGPKAVSSEGLELRLRLDEGVDREVRNSAPDAALNAFTSTGPPPQWGEETWLWPTFRLETNTKLNLDTIGDVDTKDAFSWGGWIKPRNVPGGKSWNTKAGALISRMDPGNSFRGWELYYNADDSLTVQLIHTHPANMLSLATVGTTETRDPFQLHEGHHGGTPRNITLPRGNWRHVFVTYDGSAKAVGIKIYINGLEQKVKVVKDTLTESIRSKADTWLGQRHNSSPMQGTAYQDIRLYRRALTADEVGRMMREDVAAEIVAAKPQQQDWTADERRIVEDAYFKRIDPVSRDLREQLPALNNRLVQLQKGGAIALICREKPGAAYADVLDRGVFNARNERVRPDVPHFLPPMPPDAPRNRLGLANWTVSPDNPLTARVTVNRMWQEVFGVGLATTVGDLGIVGERPSHPKLLDWLAVDFVEHGWQVKRLYKKILLSAAYMQSADADEDAVARDLDNRLLARGARYRLDAEVLRDLALQTSGLLVEKIGGPSVKPYQPASIWEGSYGRSATYPQGHGANLYRRSLYTYQKRMAPPPNMGAFDATDRSAVCVRRQRTNTPLAALVLMNDPQFVEAARVLGKRTLSGGDSDDSRIDSLARAVLSRPFTTVEARVMRAALTRFRQQLVATSAGDIAALLSVGESASKSSASPRNVASLTTGKPATAAVHTSGRPPSLATDGIVDRNGYWEMDAASGKPTWWQVDLLTATDVGCVVVVGYPDNSRYYGFTVETSLDGKSWELVADRRDNTELSTYEGNLCQFTRRPTRYIRINQVNNSANSGRHLVEVMAYAEAPSAKAAGLETVEQAVWMMMASTIMNCDDAINK